MFFELGLFSYEFLNKYALKMANPPKWIYRETALNSVLGDNKSTLWTLQSTKGTAGACTT